MSDDIELALAGLGFSGNSRDSDNDGTLDRYEDTDGDGVYDGDEIALGLSPAANEWLANGVSVTTYIHDDTNRLMSASNARPASPAPVIFTTSQNYDDPGNITSIESYED